MGGVGDRKEELVLSADGIPKWAEVNCKRKKYDPCLKVGTECAGINCTTYCVNSMKRAGVLHNTVVLVHTDQPRWERRKVLIVGLHSSALVPCVSPPPLPPRGGWGGGGGWEGTSPGI